MSDILADYKQWRDKQPTRIGTHSDRCHMWHERCMIHRLAAALAAEVAKRTPQAASTPGEGTSQTGCTLTDEEREAIDWAAYAAEKWYEHTAAATLRGLLKRTK